MACVAPTARFLAPSRPRVARARSAESSKHGVCGVGRVTRAVVAANASRDDDSKQASEFSTRRETLLVSALATVVFAAAPLSVTSRPAAAAAEGVTTVLVVGATGATGRLVVDELRRRADPATQIVAGVRDEKKAKKLGVDSGHVSVLPDFDVTNDVATLTGQMRGVDVAIVCLGFVPGNPFKMKAAAHAVDNEGVVRLVEAAKAAGVKRVVLISSILVDGRAMHQEDSPGFKITNAFGGVLDEKLVGEKALIASGLEYVIVRPAGLRGEPPKSELLITPGNTMASGEVSRELVAKVMAEAAFSTSAAGRIVELAETGTFAPNYEPPNVAQYLVGDDQSQWFL